MGLLVAVTVATRHSDGRAAGQEPDARASRAAGQEPGPRALRLATTSASATRPIASNLITMDLTADGSDRYELTAAKEALLITAPRTNAGANLRTVTWDPGAASRRYQQVCATWTGHTDHLAQQGLALRIHQVGQNWRMVTVTKNIYMTTYANFNVHTWDTARTVPLAKVGSIHLQRVVEGGLVVKPLPWRICGRAEGNRITLKGWPTIEAEPSWDDPNATGAVELPPGWDVAGGSGWFAGHLRPGWFVAADDLYAGPVPTDR